MRRLQSASQSRLLLATKSSCSEKRTEADSLATAEPRTITRGPSPSCDAQPVAIRQLLLQVVRDVQEGKDPPGVAFRPEDNNMGNITLVHATIPDGIDPFDVEAVQEHMVGSPVLQRVM